MLIDTHAHLNDEFFKDKLDKVISDAYLNGVEKIFTVSYSLKSIDECVKISEKNGKTVFDSEHKAVQS